MGVSRISTLKKAQESQSQRLVANNPNSLFAQEKGVGKSYLLFVQATRHGNTLLTKKVNISFQRSML